MPDPLPQGGRVPRAVEWAEQHLGPVSVAAATGEGPVPTVADPRGAVLTLTDARSTRWVLKIVPSRRGWRAENRSYRMWVPAFADQAPRLLDSEPDLRALLMTHRPGTPGWTFAPTAHRDAGALLGRIHRCRPARAEGRGLWGAAGRMLDRTRLRIRDARQGHTVTSATLDTVAQRVDDLRAFDHLLRVPCHGDYGGHNWLRGPDGLQVIDFSGSRWNPAPWDFARLAIGAWWERPDLVEAFLDGYGRRLSDEEEAAVTGLLPVFALNVLGHGLLRDDPEMVRRGRRRLALVLAGHDPGVAAPWWRRLARQTARGPRALGRLRGSGGPDAADGSAADD